MVITRAPFRIPLGGGGTDLPFYAETRGGSLITAAINRYVYVFIHRRLLDKLIWLSYSEQEKQSNVNAVKHELIREALNLTGVNSSVEIHSVSEISDRSGVGGSSTFLTALLQALYTYKGSNVSKNKLAEDAIHIERVILKQNGGVQDQYVAAHGGFCSIENTSLTDVQIKNLPIKQDVIDKLSQNLLLFYTGVQRLSSSIIKTQTDERTSNEIIGFYDRIKDIGLTAKHALLTGDTDTFGKTFHEHWMLKRNFTKKMSNGSFDEIYEKAMQYGALGGKIIGAGGGGFFLFYVPDNQARFCEKIKELGLTHLDFDFDFEGTTTLFNGDADKSINQV